ncbi:MULTISPECIES: hypothetical protein [unclassified Tolypothrix]|uniref:hypothetical protein n=1 Tax=unclassified Tolypothrix TaxID=2649714 RepID=UPI0012D818AF|nr:MULTISPECIES: hypothetical protein [unclassified Tolypothrix]MBE9088046.1 hypothetical protein [Tolypothrix sp. LEGE 11397]UYD28787.1 hypothetical protein HGR01_12560 [Tolypothrix sp. PCC 7712]UYD35302.1 hypothetical protein HG267_05800 [Tolypothrix sp. PCC 7601]
MKNSIPLWVEFLGMGNRAWGMAKKLPMPNAPSGGAAVPLRLSMIEDERSPVCG